MARSVGWGSVVFRAVVMGALLGALTWFACVVIPPFSDWAQETAACQGAEKIERDVRDGGTVGYGTQARGTTVFTLRCTYADGEVKTVGNDRATVAGFAFGFLVGFVPGTAISLVRRTIRKVRADRGPTTPVPTSSPTTASDRSPSGGEAVDDAVID